MKILSHNIPNRAAENAALPIGITLHIQAAPSLVAGFAVARPKSVSASRKQTYLATVHGYVTAWEAAVMTWALDRNVEQSVVDDLMSDVPNRELFHARLPHIKPNDADYVPDHDKLTRVLSVDRFDSNFNYVTTTRLPKGIAMRLPIARSTKSDGTLSYSYSPAFVVDGKIIKPSRYGYPRSWELAVQQLQASTEMTAAAYERVLKCMPDLTLWNELGAAQKSGDPDYSYSVEKMVKALRLEDY
mgnify:CR=1 FL=1